MSRSNLSASWSAERGGTLGRRDVSLLIRSCDRSNPLRGELPERESSEDVQPRSLGDYALRVRSATRAQIDAAGTANIADSRALGAQSATRTFLKAADAGSVRSSMRPASSWERGAHKLA